MGFIHQYIENNRERFLSGLFELIRIPSVSAKSRHRKDLIHAAEFLKGIETIPLVYKYFA